jgi:hypothetical protein
VTRHPVTQASLPSSAATRRRTPASPLPPAGSAPPRPSSRTPLLCAALLGTVLLAGLAAVTLPARAVPHGPARID